jgi:hypothetical protein
LICTLGMAPLWRSKRQFTTALPSAGPGAGQPCGRLAASQITPLGEAQAAMLATMLPPRAAAVGSSPASSRGHRAVRRFSRHRQQARGNSKQNELSAGRCLKTPAITDARLLWCG